MHISILTPILILLKPTACHCNTRRHCRAHKRTAQSNNLRISIGNSWHCKDTSCRAIRGVLGQGYCPPSSLHDSIVIEHDHICSGTQKPTCSNNEKNVMPSYTSIQTSDLHEICLNFIAALELWLATTQLLPSTPTFLTHVGNDAGKHHNYNAYVTRSIVQCLTIFREVAAVSATHLTLL